MNDMIVLFKKELLEHWRTKKILILFIIFIFVAISSPIFAKLTPEILKSINVPGLSIKIPEPTYIDALDQFIKNISQIALLVLVFIVSGAVSEEKNKKTLEIVLTKPISRTKFILSKFVSYFFSISVVFIISSVLFYIYTTTTFEWFNLGGYILMVFIVLLYIIMIIAITILSSTIVNNSIIAGGIGFVSYILFGTVFSLIKEIKKYSPNIIFSNYKDVVQNGWTNELTIPIIICLLVIFLSIYFSILIFNKQEIER